MRRFGYEEERSWYDVAQICQNGHVANDATQKYPDQNKRFCDKCGEPTIIDCPACVQPIRSEYHVAGVGVLDAKRVPALGSEQAQRLLDPDAVANRLMEEWMP